MAKSELTAGMKAKLHELVEASDTEAIFSMVAAIRETDTDVPYRVVVDFTPGQWSFLEEKEAIMQSRKDTILRIILDNTIIGVRNAELKKLRGGKG